MKIMACAGSPAWPVPESRERNECGRQDGSSSQLGSLPSNHTIDVIWKEEQRSREISGTLAQQVFRACELANVYTEQENCCRITMRKEQRRRRRRESLIVKVQPGIEKSHLTGLLTQHMKDYQRLNHRAVQALSTVDCRRS